MSGREGSLEGSECAAVCVVNVDLVVWGIFVFSLFFLATEGFHIDFVTV